MNNQTVVPEPLVLTSDPKKSKDKEFRRVHRDPVAWTLWLAIKPSHLTNQHFNSFCLRAAQRIKSQKPTTLSELHRVIRQAQHPIGAGYLSGELEKNALILQRILDAIAAETPIEYKVIIPGSKEDLAHRRREFFKGYDDYKAKVEGWRAGPYMTGWIIASNNQPRRVPKYILE